MALFVFRNGEEQKVIQDLQTICPGTMVDPDSGRVLPPTSSTTVGCATLVVLALHHLAIGLEGGSSPDIVVEEANPVLGKTGRLGGRAGITRFDRLPPTAVYILYDVTDCRGRGYHVFDENRTKIPFPRHVILLHELEHARQLVYASSADELPVIAVENDYRFSRGLLERMVTDAEVSTIGGCN